VPAGSERASRTECVWKSLLVPDGRTEAAGHGAFVLVEATVQPGRFVAAAHVHPHQSERFEVLEGTLGL
jgi:uncharacterized cupin superfamily protein